MEVQKLPIEGAYLITPKVYSDDRGHFFESYHDKRLNEVLGTTRFVQDNESYSKKHTLRGLHYQVGEFAMAKLVRVAYGEVQDVLVDIREGSPTYGEWYSAVLSSENHRQLFVPRGCAHGFLVLSESAVFSYKCDNYYSKEHEGSVLWNDPMLNIDWQLDKGLLLSPKDQMAPLFGNHRRYNG